MDLNKNAVVPKVLKECLSEIPKAVLAFSGGVDSSYLLYAAIESGVDVKAYYVASQFQPQFELEDALKMAEELGAIMDVVPVDILSNELVKGNGEERCYYCKQMMFKAIEKKAAEDGYNVIMDGSNASDDESDRPGMRALSEMDVRSPLRETGITKDQVRNFSKSAKLFTWDKPEYACLATRLPTGVPIDSAMLQKIEKAEQALALMGFTDFRARIVGDTAKLQMPASQIPAVAARYAEVHSSLSLLFGDVVLDLKPR
ncbi:MAG: ATP-dependent sacrificial sulfur transferase LarE [Eubacteriaceae bacterium]|nr:ATP-dependent sacrificial sulfur transferase LarE [Eubacteriaceae bacterium]